LFKLVTEEMGGPLMTEMPKYLDTGLNFVERARDLVARMTLEEKVTQMRSQSPAIPRLGIPAYNWWGEALHGVARAGVATMFPQAIAMAATFDSDLLFRVAMVISTEARAKFHEFQRYGDHGIYKGLTLWSPNLNIFRDPRWGRGQETYGEDPYLTGRLAVAFIRGLQGADPKYLKTAACAKHFVVHSGPEKERHRFDAVVSPKDLRETYLPAFKECVQEAQVEAVMGAYNRVNGELCCGSPALLQKILREEWGFQGHVVSDCWAIKDFHENHAVTRTALESAALAVNSGCDLNCGNIYGHLLLAHQEGLVSEATIDRAVTRLMTTRLKLGLFDGADQVVYADIPYEMNDCREHRNFALEVAKESLVLLKNANRLLPLDKRKLQSIAVIGPNANSRAALVGNYYGTASQYTTVLDGIRQAVVPGTRVYYAEGCHLFREKMNQLGEPHDRLAEALAAAGRSDVVVLCLGLDASLEGEEGDTSNEFASGDRINLGLPSVQQQLLERIYQVGKPVILVLISGSALAVTWADEHVAAIIQAFYPGASGGIALASLLFGAYSPAGRLPVTFYRDSGELPDFEDYSMRNRTYRYMRNEALYPFGYGLSYTSFEYSQLTLSETALRTDENLECRVKVKNTGNRDGAEVVQLYVQDVEASVVAPRWQLRGARKVFLKVGETVEVRFSLTPRQLALIDDAGRCILEPGKFKIFVGGAQPDERSRRLTGQTVLEAELEVSGVRTELEY
jgi:beta-glucosidase